MPYIAVSGLLLPENGQLGYFTLIIGSALAVFTYPHAVTGILAAKDRATIKRNAAAMPLYCLALGFMALLGLFAIGQGVRPVGGDLNTVMPQLFDITLPPWSAGIAYAAIGVAALIPAAVMSIAAANLFTRSIYREYLRKNASEAEEATVSRYASLLMKVGAVACIVGFDQQLSIELQLIGGVVILQPLPAVVAGLWTSWFHRFALAAGLLTGLAVNAASAKSPVISPMRGRLRDHQTGAHEDFRRVRRHSGALCSRGRTTRWPRGPRCWPPRCPTRGGSCWPGII